jgi:uncharacterized protein YbcV (DUF1398 family)
MGLKEKVNAVYAQITPAWGYPQLFEALKKAGVSSYETNVAIHSIHYYGVDGDFIQEIPSEVLSISKEFNQEALIKAIRRSQAKETDYQTFLKEIAQAGVPHYKVNMQERTVSYFGCDPTRKYVEKVPE